MEEAKLKEILLAESYVSQEDMKQAEEQAEIRHVSFLDILFGKELLTKDIVGQAVAEYFKVPYSDLNTYVPTAEQVQKIPEDIAKKFRIVLFGVDESGVVVTTDDPSRADLMQAVSNAFPNTKISITYSLSEDIDGMFVNYKRALATRFSEIIKTQKSVAPQMFEEIINDALAYRASDIHWEPQEKEVIVRFRIDGILQEAGRIPKQYYENILNRIKVQANMRIDEHFAAQDGSIRYIPENGKEIDLRISIMPTLNGEKVVARVLATYVQGFNLSDLGLSNKFEEMLSRAAKKPFGMIIVAGPTGSGKSTTLYALLKHINNSGINVTTIEDPVEYRIDGVNQMQVNSRVNLTFASGLKSIVRQDPDIILVGEIRDHETAEIAVNAALTGHLLFSTFHANDASTVVPRILDMGVEPFLLGSTLELILSQRLVRKLCEKCRYGAQVGVDELQKIHPAIPDYLSSPVTIYRGKGCEVCNQTGYKGRTGIFEFIPVDAELKELIIRRPSAIDIWKMARKKGAISLFEDGLEKVKRGVTSLEELLRVAQPPDKAYDRKK